MTADDPSTTRLSRDDRLLMERLRAGDGRAIAAIERRYGDELRLFCRRMLGDAARAEDIVQDVLATCCRLEAESLPAHSIRGWLYQVARRRCIDVQRKQHDAAPPAARAVRAVQRSFDHAIDPLTTPAGKALKQDRALRILAVLQELDEDLRSVVVMRYFQELPREEIAEAIGLSVAGTKARLSKAMDVLRAKLQQFDDSMLS
ncbi:MAG: RNA polymerase sigma factor [Planctomycetes bacterium]|nr:RNA polymerase sigma factor [Planctomycetota bacterium]